MTIKYDPRYPGARWTLLYGNYTGIEQFAVNELQAVVQEFLPYTIETLPAAQTAVPAEGHVLLVGTPDNNRHINELVRRGQLNIPAAPESYAIRCMESPFSAGHRLIAIAGSDVRGVLYGVEDFNARTIANAMPENPIYLRKCFDELPDLDIRESPKIANRGIWTWGYVIYDYRRFFDNMARLRMNMITIWNDCPPINCAEILQYAHDRGIRVILGFHWGWGVPGIDLTKPEDRATIRGIVVDNYRQNYAQLDIDGIYFQTLTEHHHLDIGGVSVAKAACQLVNETARALYEIRPDLYIQFGLHATSIRERYMDLADLDPRVVIVWEDAGAAVPYGYFPARWKPGQYTAAGAWNASPEETLEYSKKLATFRPGTEFGMVPKGWINLRWPEEFEHHESFILGERSPAFIQRRLQERQPHWDKVNRLWLTENRHASRFYREIIQAGPPKMTVTALVEDGMFEAAIQPSVSLFAQTIWDPFREDEELIHQALSPYWSL